MDNSISEYFSDIVMEAPHAFSTDENFYYLYPLCLGKLLLLQRMLEAIGMDEERLSNMPVLEVVATVRKHRDTCLRIVALAISPGKRECLDVQHSRTMTEELSASLTDEDIATLMVHILTDDKTDKVKKHYGIDKENDAMNAVMKAKSQGGAMSFGGKTLLGALIDQACERYGWTVDYVVWGISYATLRLMLADRVNTIYLSEDERKKLPSSVLQRDEEVIVASRETMEQIKAMGWR